MAGCKGLWESEQLTAGLSVAARRQLGLPRRLADTTARDALCPVSVDELRSALHRLVRAAWRRKALEPVGLPVSVMALDGKVTALPCLNQPFVQTQHPEVGSPYGLVRTMTAALVSAPGQPCIDAIPIPASTNEVGHFQAAFEGLVETYGSLFDLVSYDAGGFSRANADAVVAAGQEHLFALEDEHRTMCRLADEMLASEAVLDRTEDVLDNATTVVRSLRLIRADPSWSYGDGQGPAESLWPHAKAFLSMEYVKVQDGTVIERDDPMFVSSLDPQRLTSAQWLLLVRSHWGVENQNHHTLDTAFAEDDRPWIEADANGMLAARGSSPPDRGGRYARRLRYRLPQPFEQIDHTADLGVSVEGANEAEALARLVLALGALLAGGGPAEPRTEERVECAGGPDLCGTALAALRELLYRFATARLIPVECEVLRLDERAAELRVAFAPWDPALHGEGTDVKAVTWHAASFERRGGGWRAQVVFDV
jgi:SHS2 domain-containing protein